MPRRASTAARSDPAASAAASCPERPRGARPTRGSPRAAAPGGRARREPPRSRVDHRLASLARRGGVPVPPRGSSPRASPARAPRRRRRCPSTAPSSSFACSLPDRRSPRRGARAPPGRGSARTSRGVALYAATARGESPAAVARSHEALVHLAAALEVGLEQRQPARARRRGASGPARSRRISRSVRAAASCAPRGGVSAAARTPLRVAFARRGSPLPQQDLSELRARLRARDAARPSTSRRPARTSSPPRASGPSCPRARRSGREDRPLAVSGEEGLVVGLEGALVVVEAGSARRRLSFAEERRSPRPPACSRARW